MKKRPSAISETVSGAMRSMPEHSTGPEMAVRRLLYASGLRYRVQYPVPGAPRRSIDIAFPGKKVAVFIDGCFWHGCAEHRNIPAHNRDWWQNKIDQNRSRDRDTDEKLSNAGWQVLRYWEHDPAERIVSEVHNLFGSRETQGIKWQNSGLEPVQ
ncbi:very short patch repair endonuclease [Geobacter argillaceus]|uniref:very short patch repair endonuclease n=1 Tax=Geobacter argillaceus TaxID=345631 RepID=UPI001B8685A8|nr:very short patch repair endonuclease [Geobacter argillaceus]